MKENHEIRVAHPNTYSIANIIVFVVLCSIVTIITWRYLLIWWPIKIGLLLLAMLIIAFIEHHYISRVVGYVVEQLFPNQEITIRYREVHARIKKARHRGHW